MKRNTVKRNVSLALGAVLVFGAVPAYAADAVTVKLNGSQMEFDVNPVIENSRTLVPFRKIFEALDCAVSYTKENGAQVVTANRGNQWITLEIGKNEITVDGETKKLDVAPKIVNGRTLVPLRAISEGLDCTVDWSADTKTVDIQKKQGQYAVTSAHISKNITDDKGNILITIAFEYPVIENKDNNAFITAVNEQYKKDAEAAISEAEAEFKDSAAAVLASEGKNYHPMVFTRSFEVSLNQDNLLSITQLDYANTYGAHPNTLKSSKTFNLAGLVGSYHIVYNSWWRDRMEKESSLSHYNMMNVLSMHALIGAYKPEGYEWTDELCEVLTGNIDFACDYIEKHFEGVTVSKPQGTYMLFVDCTDWCKAHGKTIEDVEHACWDVGAAIQDGTMFFGPCHLRMNLASPRSRIEEAFHRMDKYVFNA
mgnify:FL=1